MKTVCKALIHLYKLTLSPFFGSCCRFTPSCSTYALEAIEKHGTLKGGWLTLKRLIKCNALHPGGNDPI